MPRAGWLGYQDDAVPPPVGNTREVNQAGYEQRGVGTALVYYASKSRWSPLPGATFEVERQRSGVLSWFVGYHLTSYRLAIQQGYDRYNEFQTLDHKAFAKALMTSVIVGIRTTDQPEGESPVGKTPIGMMLFAGYGFPFFVLDQQAQGAHINSTGRSLIVGIGVYIRHTR